MMKILLGCLQILGSSGSTSRKQVYLATKSEKLPGQVSTGWLNAKRQKKNELLCLKRQGEHMPSKNGGDSALGMMKNPNIKPFGHEASKAIHFLKVVTKKSRHENPLDHYSVLVSVAHFPLSPFDPPPSLSSVRTYSGERSTYSAWNSLEHQGGKTCTTWRIAKNSLWSQAGFFTLGVRLFEISAQTKWCLFKVLYFPTSMLGWARISSPKQV